MSIANRKMYTMIASMVYVCERNKYDAVYNHLTGEGAEVMAFDIKQHQLIALRRHVLDKTLLLVDNYSTGTIINVWIAWCEDTLDKLSNKGKIAFISRLHELLVELADTNIEDASEASNIILKGLLDERRI